MMLSALIYFADFADSIDFSKNGLTREFGFGDIIANIESSVSISFVNVQFGNDSWTSLGMFYICGEEGSDQKWIPIFAVSN